MHAVSWKAAVLAACLAGALFVFVWPTPYVYVNRPDGLERVNRFTGVMQAASVKGWRTPAPAAPVDPVAEQGKRADRIRSEARSLRLTAPMGDPGAVLLRNEGGTTVTAHIWAEYYSGEPYGEGSLVAASGDPSKAIRLVPNAVVHQVVVGPGGVPGLKGLAAGTKLLQVTKCTVTEVRLPTGEVVVPEHAGFSSVARPWIVGRM